jgi:serine/threonine protein kinase
MVDTICIRSPPRVVRPPAPDSLIGLELQGYVILRALSAGGMGVVYEARHALIGRRAAVKVLRPELNEDPDLTQRFLREACALSAIKHRNIVEILNFGVLPGGGQYMMMEFLEGETLGELIARKAPLNHFEALKIAEEILAGLAAAHQVGVVHRDLKPGNIILTKQSSDDLIVKVLDFGLARRVDATQAIACDALQKPRRERASILAGTPEYISPEQASGRPADGQADLYSLGVILFEMLSGRLPFEGSAALDLLQMHRTALPPRLRQRVPQIPVAIEVFVDQLLSKAPGSRPLSAKIAREMVRTIRDELAAPPGAHPIRALPIFQEHQFADTVMHLEPPKPAPRSGGRAGLAVLALLAAGLTTVAAAASRQNLFSPNLDQETSLAHAVQPGTVLEKVPVLSVAPAEVTVPKTSNSPPAPKPEVQEPSLINVQEDAVNPVEIGSDDAIEELPRPARRALRQPHLKPAPAALTGCLNDEGWRRGARERIEDLEQLALAGVSDLSDPTEIARIKNRARELTFEVRSSDGAPCEHVEAQLRSWRAVLK